MTLNVNPSILNGVYLPPITSEGYLLTYDKGLACGGIEFNIQAEGTASLLDYVEILGGIEINPPVLNICKLLTYYELNIEGPIFIPICFEGRGTIKTYTNYPSNDCFQWEFPDSLKNKIMSILSLKPEYTTTDLRELLSVHRITLPELGEGIDYDIPGVLDNLKSQDRIKFHVLKSKVIGFRSEEMVRNWLVGVIEYNSYPCAIFLNAYWDEYSNYPLRYILSSMAFREMVTYVKSLLACFKDYSDIDLYNTNHDANTLKFRLNTDYTMVLDTPLNKEALIEMDTNIGKFLSIYTSYKNI